MSIRRPSRGGDVHQSAITDLPESAAPVLLDLIEERFARWDAGHAGVDGQRQIPTDETREEP